jgi:hypothetical protein
VIRKRLQREHVEHAEDRRVRADPERECRDGGKRETGAPPHQSTPVSHVLQQGLHDTVSCSWLVARGVPVRIRAKPIDTACDQRSQDEIPEAESLGMRRRVPFLFEVAADRFTLRTWKQ